jgi:hypothetical protein
MPLRAGVPLQLFMAPGHDRHVEALLDRLQPGHVLLDLDAVAAVDARGQRLEIVAHEIEHALAAGADLLERVGVMPVGAPELPIISRSKVVYGFESGPAAGRSPRRSSP